MRAAPVSMQPRVTLVHWAFVEAGDAFFLVGYCIETRKGRVSTAIESIDPETMTVKTRSGREYRLTGSPAAPTDADRIRLLWDAAIGVDGRSEE